ncbi:MAG: FecR domain-containing protein [Clostridiales bacterium]|nr:FecR domain-containing protein [Clostridiales bacterium]
MNSRFRRFAIVLGMLAILMAVPGKAGAPEYRSIFVVAVSGDAMVARQGLSREMFAYEGMKLQDGDVVTTPAGSGLVLKLDDDKYEYLEPDTQLEIVAAGGPGNTMTTIRLMKGAVSSAIQQKLGPGETFSVTVDNVSMVVRGTVFRVVLGTDGEGNSTVIVQTVEGEVGINTGSGEEHSLGCGLQAEVLFTEDGGMLGGADEPIHYEDLPEETRNWLREVIRNQLNNTDDSEKRDALKAILAAIDDNSPDNASENQTKKYKPTPRPKYTPKPTPQPNPQPNPEPET